MLLLHFFFPGRTNDWASLNDPTAAIFCPIICNIAEECAIQSSLSLILSIVEDLLQQLFPRQFF
jgi:hypothetical protein